MEGHGNPQTFGSGPERALVPRPDPQKFLGLPQSFLGLSAGGRVMAGDFPHDVEPPRALARWLHFFRWGVTRLDQSPGVRRVERVMPQKGI